MEKPKDNIWDPGAEKALKIATDLLQAISKVFSVHIDGSINQMCKQTKRWISGSFYTINRATQSALSAYL